jgi:hypothetical protein
MNPNRLLSLTVLCCATALSVNAAPDAPAGKARKTEKPVNFIPAKPNPVVGDWQGDRGSVAQVIAVSPSEFNAVLLTGFEVEGKPVAALRGTSEGGAVGFSGDGWTGTLQGDRFTLTNSDQHLELRHINRKPPTLGAKPPAGAVVLFDGKNLDAWAKKSGKEWLLEDGPAKWKLVEGGAMEVVPETDCIITHQKFGDCKVHVEFRTLGHPSNSGVFLQDRYEVNINETYGHFDGTANGGLDNCSEAKPRIRPCLPALEWQTFDIDFKAPRFDAAGKKNASARATVLFNGVKIYDNQELDPPHGAASRLGEAPAGPLMLQEHGMPVQFRNIWVDQSGS